MTEKTPQTKSAMWGGRFAEGPAEAMQRFNASIDEDKRLAMEDIDGSIAHAAMLGGQGIITADEAETLIDGLETVRGEIKTGHFTWKLELEDVHMNVESRLREVVGDVAGKLHTGRSRNDQVATDIRLYTRRALDQMVEMVRQVQKAFLDQAKGHEETVMPGFTHLQIAQPISYAFYCLAYVEMFERDRLRLLGVRELLNESPLGAAALAGTPHPINREQTAKALGFDRPCRNALDAVSARDFVLDTVAVASLCATHISRYAEEVVIYATPQFGYFRVGDAYSTGSSIMPQKRNPDAAELLRAKVGSIAGAFTTLTLCTKGLPLAYSKDLQDTKKPMMDALDTLGMSLDILARMIDSTTINAAAMERDASRGYSTATDLADQLAAAGTPFRDAHHIVGALVAYCEKNDLMLHEVPLSDAVKISPRINQDMLDRLTPLASICAKRSAGSTAPEEVLKQIAFWEDALA
ncbi:argininosuccinate lyase [Parvularcula sp. LCG005]|uniref:argininosuccinate lyase n=1 Tax=Parvularcula sp. LCG005 TaxID=3078805 RepID=UPI002941CE79|nr:argininosuccinate lyase [Parvularcula sp. LCG005]WOI53063.1 argininosuccinate lyase [Parvularcula sp. LCG005]